MPSGDVSLLLELSRALVAVAVRSLGAIDGEVPLAQFRALVVLKRVGPCNAGELAEAVGLHVSTLTRICDRLVTARLITREVKPASRREVELDITPAGAALVDRVWAARSAELSSALRGLTPNERDALRVAIPALLVGLGTPAADGSEDALG
ncbi:MAG: MarR family transcriptional regulator [Actinomycetota bacterium]|nr:MarR family transcriptional regulator [Actinomycetota bacterium]